MEPATRHVLSVSGLLVLLAMLPLAVAATSYTPPQSPRVLTSLNAGWRFLRADASGAQQPTFDDQAWKSVDVPHTWNAIDGQDGGSNYYRGIGWYRRHVTVSGSYAGRKFYVQFDGASMAADVFVNGSLAGTHKGGFSTFRFDVTPFVHPGQDNLIAVRVNNAYDADLPPLWADFTFFGGLHRGVQLVVADPLSLDLMDYGASGVYLTPTNVSASRADLKVVAKVRNGYTTARDVTVDTIVTDANANIIKLLSTTQTVGPGAAASFIQESVVSAPHLWNGRSDPYLYTVFVEVYEGGRLVDLLAQPLGFRSYSVDSQQGLSLNGAAFDLHGVNKHQDRFGKGWAISDADIDEDVALVHEIGANGVRLAHYQHAQRMYELADRTGLVIWSEIPLITSMTQSPAFYANAAQQLTEMIRQNYNHPSILFWGLQNELVATPDPSALITQLSTLAHAEDPTRLVTVATGSEANVTSNWLTDLTGFNSYFGWYYGQIGDFAPWLDQVHQAYPARRICTSEFGAGASVNFHSATPTALDHSEEYQNLFHEAYWSAMNVRPYLWGKFVWNMFDFAVDSRNEGDQPGRNDKGLVTYDRKTRKDAFYWFKANWSDSPFVHITSRRFDPRTTPLTDVKVYGNTDTVELVVNGVSQGIRTSVDHRFVWSGVSLRTGINTVQAIGRTGGTTPTDSVNWTVQPATVPGETHSGVWSMKLAATGTPLWTGPFQAFAGASANSSFVSKAFVRGGGQRVRLLVYDRAWKVIALRDAVTTADWTEVSTPAFATGVGSALYVQVQDTGYIPGTAYVDDVFMGTSGGVNQLRNGDFESGNTQWNMFGPFSILQSAISTGNAHGGRGAVRFSATGTPAYTGIWQVATPVARNTSYVFKGFVRGAGQSLRLIVFSSTWSTLATKVIQSTSDWVEATTPAFNTGSNSVVYPSIQDYGRVPGLSYIDDLTLGVPGGQNILKNPGFEEGAANWTLPSGFQVILDP